MKKATLFIVIACLCVFSIFTTASSVFAAQTSSGTSSTSGKVTKTQLDKLAMSALQAAEKRNNKEMKSYLYQMMENGVTSMSAPQVMAKKTPQCPPIEMVLNGRKLKGSVCVRMVYDYDGKENWVGYCK